MIFSSVDLNTSIGGPFGQMERKSNLRQSPVSVQYRGFCGAALDEALREGREADIRTYRSQLIPIA